MPLVVAPVLARMLGHPDIQRDKQVQKALAQLKLAFDNLDKLRPGVSREVVTQMFELVVNSQNPAVNSLMPPTVAALASLSLHDQQQQAASIATPGLAPHHHRAAPPTATRLPPDGMNNNALCSVPARCLATYRGLLVVW